MKFLGLEDKLFSAFKGPTQIDESFFKEEPPYVLEEVLFETDAVAFSIEKPNHYKELVQDSMGYRVLNERSV
jgi:hypothetical protein